MDTAKRFRQPWTVRECNQLQKEYDMQLSIDEIAQRHQRTPNAIMYKLDREGLADYDTLHSNYEAGTTTNCQDNESDCDDTSDYSDDNDQYNLHKRVTELETRIEELMQLIMSQNKKSGVFSSLFA
jgi:hypothetical protein